ncbi:MAG: 6-bladed beta-propeller [Muribaculaceae bacterium]|nr:6-bladed beta-propeller [Muribaculaceae bacterium]
MKKILLICGLLAANVLLLAVAACGDGRADGVKAVSIDPDNVTEIQIDERGLLPLETRDSSLLYDICDIEHIGNRYVVYSRDLLRIFDAENGRWLGNLANPGQGPGEYTFISRFRRSGDTLLVFDSNLGKEFRYLSDGTFLGDSKPFGPGPDFSSVQLRVSTYFEAPDGNGYYAINDWVGSSGIPTPAYTRYNAAGEAIGIVPGRGLRSGSRFKDRGYTDYEHGRVLVWDAFRDTLFDIAGDEVRALYAFDFGSRSLPSSVQNMPELHDRLNAFTEEGADYVSFMRYFQTKGDKLYFSISSSDEYCDYVRYNEDDGNYRIIRFVDSSGRYSPNNFLKIDGDSAIISLSDEACPETNPVLYRFPLSLFEQ